MKKLKKLLAVLLAVAAVCALVVTPASAASASFANERIGAYRFNGSLNLTATQVSARLRGVEESGGSLSPSPGCSLKGAAFDINGNTLNILRATGDLECAGASSYQGTAAKAFCQYYFLEQEITYLFAYPD